MTKVSFINVIRLVSCIASESIQFYFPEGIYLFKVNNGRTRKNVWNMFKVNNKDTRTTFGLSRQHTWHKLNDYSCDISNVQKCSKASSKFMYFYASFMCVLFINFLCIFNLVRVSTDMSVFVQIQTCFDHKTIRKLHSNTGKESVKQSQKIFSLCR